MANTGAGIWSMRSITADDKRGSARLGDFLVPVSVQVVLGGDPDDIDGHRWPDVSIRFEVRDGAAVCTELRIVSGADGRPIRTPDLTVLNLDDLAKLVFQRFAAPVTIHNDGSVSVQAPGEGASFRAVHAAVEQSYREPLAELRQVARVYLDPGSRGAPTKSVLDVLQYGSRETASRRIKLARDSGLIPAVGASDEELDAAWRALTESPPERAAESGDDRARRRRLLAERLGMNREGADNG